MFVLASDWPRYFRLLLQNCLWGQQTCQKCSSRVPQEVLFLIVIHMPHMEFTDPVYISSHMEITYPIYIIPYGNYWPRIYRIRSLTHCVTNNTCTVLGHGRISHSRMSSLWFSPLTSRSNHFVLSRTFILRSCAFLFRMYNVYMY